MGTAKLPTVVNGPRDALTPKTTASSLSFRNGPTMLLEKLLLKKLNPRASWPMLLVLCWKLALIRNEFLAHTIKSKRNTVLLRKNLLESRIWIDDLCTGLI